MNQIDKFLWEHHGGKLTRKQINAAFKDPADQRKCVEQARFHGIRVYHDYRPKFDFHGRRVYDHLEASEGYQGMG